MSDTRNTLAAVAPKQVRPRMVVKSFRIKADDWDEFVKQCEHNGENPTEVVRRMVTERAYRD